MRNIYALLLFTGLFLSTSTTAQLPSNSVAEDWTLTDIDGNTHHLYSLLDQGYTVYLDFSATWCGPCWSYHNSGAYETLYNTHGPNGTDEVRVFMIEADLSTGYEDLIGNTPSTQGNWVAGTPYPIIDLTTSDVSNDYNINYYPTLYAVCPDRKVYEMPQIGETGLDNWIASCTLDGQVDGTTDVLCYGDDDGSIDISSSGGYGTLDYDWSHGANTEDVTNLSPGTYSCTIADEPTANDGGHREVLLENIEIDGPSSPVMPNIDEANDILCHGEQSGSIDMSVSGGTPGYTYQWSNGATSEDISNLAGGTYTVTVTDNHGCEQQVSATIEEPAPLELEVIPEDATCGEQNGSLTVFGSGGTGDYMYDIGDGPSTNEYFANLAPGLYQVTIVDDNNCQTMETATINNIPPPNAEAGKNAQLDCSGDPLELDGTGSEQGPDISYAWSTSDGKIVEGENTLTPLVDEAGVYELLVIDNSSGCTSMDIVAVIAAPKGPAAQVEDPSTLTCETTEVTLDASGSEQGSNISYEWTDPEGNVISEDLEVTVDEGGTYTFYIVNEETGCGQSLEVDVPVDVAPPETEAGETAQLTCSESTIILNGEVDLDENFSPLWTTDDGNIVNGAETLMPEVDQAGVYILTVTNDENGCASSDSVEVTLDEDVPVADIEDPALLTCEVTTILLDASGSSSGMNFIYHWTTNDGNIVSGDSSLNAEVDKPGSYTLEVTNIENGCQSTTTVDVDEITEAPEAAFESVQDELTVEFNDLSTGFLGEWSWDFGDGNSSDERHPTHVYSDPGTYEVCLTVSNDCGEHTVCTDVKVSDGSDLAYESDARPCSCYGSDDGRIDLTISGGFSPYSVSWDTGDETEDIEGLTAGEYRFTITDDEGHTLEGSVEVTQPDEIAVSDLNIDHENNGDASGSITLEVNGGTPPYTYSWNNGEDTKDLEDLEAGSYELTITDDKGCETVVGPFTVEDLTAIQDVSLFENVSLYPNPVSSVLQIEKEWNRVHEITIRLNDVMGKTHYSMSDKISSLDHQIDMSSLPEGLYFIGMEIDGQWFFKTVIRQ